MLRPEEQMLLPGAQVLKEVIERNLFRYIGSPGTGTEDLEDCLRLEVSGVDAGDSTILNSRLQSKVKRGGPTDQGKMDRALQLRPG
ncbi:MAG: hypothetical protein HY644_07755 [Acidobacteria bacterium]|nr:hypothetical protein [Acidobacteriota bacterium]